MHVFKYYYEKIPYYLIDEDNEEILKAFKRKRSYDLFLYFVPEKDREKKLKKSQWRCPFDSSEEEDEDQESEKEEKEEVQSENDSFSKDYCIPEEIITVEQEFFKSFQLPAKNSPKKRLRNRSRSNKKDSISITRGSNMRSSMKSSTVSTSISIKKGSTLKSRYQ